MKKRPKKDDGPSPEQRVGDWYVMHDSGQLGHTDKRWNDVNNDIRLVAIRSVHKAGGSCRIPPKTRPDLIDSVQFALFKKFFERKLGKIAEIKNFESFVRTAAFHTTVQCLRGIKSVLPGHLVSDPKLAEKINPEASDTFIAVRSAMQPFRLPAHAVARDALLLFRLATNSYPGPDWIRAFAPSNLRRIVYIAAVYDINVALLEVANEHQRAA